MKIKKLIKNILRFLLRILFYFFRPIVRIFLRPLYKYPKIWKLLFDIKNDIIDIIEGGGSIEDDKPTEYIDVDTLFYSYFSEIRKFKYIYTDDMELRFNIVIDSLAEELFFGGVATSLILATLFVNKYNIPLRIIVRYSEAFATIYNEMLTLVNIEVPSQIEFFTDYEEGNANFYRRLDVRKNDIFLATSWWSAFVINQINRRRRFFYILQEVETLFYSNSDKKRACNDVLKQDNIDFLINTKFLFDYFKLHGYHEIVKNSIIFEPAFPKKFYYKPKNKIKKQKRKLFFYARPNNERNLFITGVKFLNEAIKQNIINVDEWEIFMAGSKQIPNIRFDNGYEPKNLGILSWKDYTKFVMDIDLGFILMYTPHPSYPPLDIVASGGVVLTNRYENKQDLSEYSKNIIMTDLKQESMLKGFSKAIELVKNERSRMKNYKNNKLKQTWEDSFKRTLDFMKKKI